MAAPVAIGTRGTIGSLVRKEIEYLAKFEFQQGRSSRKAQPSIVDTSSGQSRPTKPASWFSTFTWKKKRRRGSTSSGFIPSIFSMAEAADSTRLNRNIPHHSYRILKDDDPESLLLQESS